MSEIAKHWIDGEGTGSGTVSESVNPATGAVLGRRRGPLAITEFTEAKTGVHAIPPFPV